MPASSCFCFAVSTPRQEPALNWVQETWDLVPVQLKSATFLECCHVRELVPHVGNEGVEHEHASHCFLLVLSNPNGQIPCSNNLPALPLFSLGLLSFSFEKRGRLDYWPYHASFMSPDGQQFQFHHLSLLHSWRCHFKRLCKLCPRSPQAKLRW